MEEKWKWIEGYEGLYEVSNKGRVKSHIKHKIMKLNLHSKLKKYYSIMLYKDEIPKRFLVHRLVALAFIENPKNENFVNHKDGNGHNNVVENLEWVSHKQNMEHASKHNLNHKGEDVYNAKLTNDQVLEICYFLDNTDISQSVIGSWYGVPQTRISKINLGYAWNWLTDRRLK